MEPRLDFCLVQSKVGETQKVQMTVKTHLYGRDKKERLKELILDEHEECGCQCNDLTAALCAGTFNEK